MDSNEIRILIGRRIREERFIRNLTIEELSEMANISPSFLGLVERGKKFLSVENLYSVSKALGIPVDSFFHERIQMKPIFDDYIKFIFSNLNEKELLMAIDIMKIIRTGSTLEQPFDICDDSKVKAVFCTNCKYKNEQDTLNKEKIQKKISKKVCRNNRYRSYFTK